MSDPIADALAVEPFKEYPHSLAAERGVLGSILAEADCLALAGDLEPEDFYRAEHGRLFWLLRKMTDEGAPIDLVTVGLRISRHRTPEVFGDLVYVCDLPSYYIARGSVPYYAEVVRKDALRRRAIAIAEWLADELRHDGDPEALVGEAVARLAGRETGKVVAMVGR